MHTQHERPVAIVAALDMEAQALARNLPRSGGSSPGFSVWEGTLEGKSVVLAVTGVGKVAAALATQFLCDTRRPAAILVFGLAGAIDSETERGQLIVASGAVQHDVDARPLTDAPGVLPGLGTAILPSDLGLSEKLLLAARSAVGRRGTVLSGVVLTGDQIVTSRATRDRLTAEFPGGACVDMETAAVAQVAQQNGIPWAGLRMTSDSADESFDLDKVLRFGGEAAELFDGVVGMFLNEL